MQKLPFYPLLVLLLAGLGGYLGCDPASVSPPINPASNTASGQVQTSPYIPARTGNTILIGSYNLQRLGPSKAKDQSQMDRLADVIRQFDLIALQEITDSSGASLPQLVNLVNKNGARYQFVVSPRVGRQASGYYEQYAFVFDSDRIAGGEAYCYMVNDEQDYLHREPHVGRFATKSNHPFTFTLINIHTDPDTVRSELNDLANVLVQVRNYEYPEDDVILLGDLNQGPGKMGNLDQIPGFQSVISIPTNTRRSHTLDHVMFDRRLTSEFSGRSGAIDVQAMFGISLDEALNVSDHLPIWAEFIATETPEAPAAQTAGLNGLSSTQR